jgi:Holliday junction resolvasome RuvABC ATP-dependent DNA helicase subunit/archaellum biogenesis ATPase FlaH
MEKEKQSLHVKYRPETWDDVIGNKNEKTVNNLKAVLKKGNERTFLISGATGCGKTTIARLIKKELGCSDIDFLEINAGNLRGLDTIREVLRDCLFSPIQGSTKIFFFDEAHQITGAAAEALLKATEEPPAGVYFILATTNPKKLPEALRGRCTEYKVFPLSLSEMKELLTEVISKEKIVGVTDNVVGAISHAAGGCPRKALVILGKLKDLETEKEMLEAIPSYAKRVKSEAKRDLGLKGLTLKDFKQFGGLTYLIDQFLPTNSLIILAGREGTGKSLLAGAIIKAILSDDEDIRLFGKYEVFRGGPVLSIDEENPGMLLKERIDKFFVEYKGKIVGVKHPFECLHFQKIKLEDRTNFKRLVEKIREFNPVLLVIDSLSKIHKGSEASQQKIGIVMEKLRELVNAGEKQGMAVLVIHHHSKAGSIRGSTVIPADVDIEYSLKRDEKGYLILKSEKTRLKAFGPIKLELNTLNDRLRILYVGDVSEDIFGELKKICGGNDWMDYKTISDRLFSIFSSLKHGKLRYTLKKYVEEGKIDEDSIHNPKGGKPILRYKLKKSINF